MGWIASQRCLSFSASLRQSKINPFCMDSWIQEWLVVDHRISGYQKESLKPRDTLSCSRGCWAFLGNDFNAGSSVQSKHRLTLNENTVRGWEAGPKVCIVESNIRGRLKISSWCLGKTFVFSSGYFSSQIVWSWNATALTRRKERAVLSAWLKFRRSCWDQKEVCWVTAGELRPVTLSTALSQLSCNGRQCLPAPSWLCWATAEN